MYLNIHEKQEMLFSRLLAFKYNVSFFRIIFIAEE